MRWGEPTVFDSDEWLRRDTDMEPQGRRRPVMGSRSVAAGNAGSRNVAASVCLMAADVKVDKQRRAAYVRA